MPYRPRINHQLEEVTHERWQNGRLDSLAADNTAIRAEMARQAKNTATLGRRTIKERPNPSTTYGLPEGGTTGNIVRKVDSANGNATWTTEWQGLMPEYWVTLDSVAGASYFTSSLGGPNVLEADNEALAATLLPPVQFDDTGTIMYPIDTDNYPDTLGTFGSSGQAPIHLYVEVFPSFANEEFTIYLPSHDNFNGVTSPFYTFELYNAGAYDADVKIADTYLYYDGTSIPVLGVDNPLFNPWTIEPGFYSSWAVRNVRGWGALASPAAYYTGGTPAALMSDPWFEANVKAMRLPFSVPKDGALSVATLPRRTYNDTIGDLTIGKVTASVGTAPSGVDLTLVVKKNGTSITTSFAVTAGTNTGTAVLSDTSWVVGDYLTIEVTQTGSAADLNVQIWAG